MATFTKGIAAATRAGVRTPRVATPRTARDIANLYGGNSAWATELAGTANKRSPEYKAALRRVQRWTKGTRSLDRTDRATRERIHSNAAARTRRERDRVRRDATRRRETELRSRGALVTVDGDLRVSSRTQRRKIGKRVSGDVLAGMLDATRRGDDQAAAALFLDSYGIGRAASWVDVRSVDLS